MSYRIAVVVGSTRPQRICRQIAEWILTTVQRESELSYELLDLADVNLPLLDEPEMAATGIYAHEHSKRWSAIVASFDGFVFVMPQYNWGYTAVVKNALDFCYAEWSGKPASTVTYGTRGGGRGAEQLQQVFQGLHMRATATNVALNTTPALLNAEKRFTDIDAAFADAVPSVRAMDADITELLAQAPVRED